MGFVVVPGGGLREAVELDRKAFRAVGCSCLTSSVMPSWIFGMRSQMRGARRRGTYPRSSGGGARPRSLFCLRCPNSLAASRSCWALYAPQFLDACRPCSRRACARDGETLYVLVARGSGRSVISTISERLMRRPPEADMPRQFLNESAMSACVGIVVMVLFPVLDLHGMERDVDHVAICPVLRHLDPVAHVDHVVAGELDAGDEREDRVAEDQQQHRRHGADAG